MAFERPQWITKGGKRIPIGQNEDKAGMARGSARAEAVKSARDSTDKASDSVTKQALSVRDFIKKTERTDFSSSPAVVRFKDSKGREVPSTIGSIEKGDKAVILTASSKGKMSYSEVADKLSEASESSKILMRDAEGHIHALKEVEVDYDDDDPDGGNMFVMDFARGSGIEKGYEPKRVR